MADVINREMLKVRKRHISMRAFYFLFHFISKDALASNNTLSRFQLGQPRHDPGTGSQGAEDRAQDFQMLNDPRSQEIEAGEHQGQREEDGDESSGQNRGSEVGAEATPIHEKTGMKTEWEVAPGLQDRRASENSERTRASVLLLQAMRRPCVTPCT